jgi:3-hydroxyisobutyrate dehydrogenase-like beta-hydroxyacid dehydrogenase
MNIGFVGLGSMGLPMARNLLKAGHHLTVWNRTRSRADELRSLGAQVAESPGQASATGLIMSMLADDAAVQNAVSGEQGIFGALPKGGIHICLSTISTALSQQLTEAHQQRGQIYVAAPVFGRPEAAEGARLLVVVAGPPEAIERCRPLFEAIGRKLFIVGPEALKAHAVKLAGNFMISSMVETLGEAFAFLRKSEVDLAKFHEVVIGSLFQSPIYENYGRIVLEQKYEPAGFKLRLGLKDARLILEAAEAVAAPMPVASLVHDHLLSGVAKGQGEIDWSSTARVIAENAGLKS